MTSKKSIRLFSKTIVLGACFSLPVGIVIVAIYVFAGVVATV
jgi:hypothetical protein